MKKILNRLRPGRILIAFIAAFAGLLCFTSASVADDFLKQLGLSEKDADTRITQGFLSGYVNTYAITQAKNIPFKDHPVVVMSAISYARKLTEKKSFKEEYEHMRQQHKPDSSALPLTPDSLRQTLIDNAGKSLNAAEAALKNATGEMKQAMEELVKSAKEVLAEAKSTDNAYLQMYRENYPALLQNARQAQAALMDDWVKKYPLQANEFIKIRLEQFMRETNGVDFNAVTEMRNGKRVFVNPQYERKDMYWKLAYRMGAGAIETARKDIQAWLNDLHNSR